LALLLPAFFIFWFVTAPASMALQRIAAGTGRGPVSVFAINAADWYDTPMTYLVKIHRLKVINDFLADAWCEILDAPETTPRRK
jgi:hypothetical protein